MGIELSKEESEVCKGLALAFVIISHMPRVLGALP